MGEPLRGRGRDEWCALLSDGSRYRCRSAFGLSNVSYYHPIADSLAYYGPRYGVTTW